MIAFASAQSKSAAGLGRFRRSPRLLAGCAVAVAIDLSVPGASAQDIASAAGPFHPRSAGLGLFDWLVIGFYLAFLLGLGWYNSRRQTDDGEYFIASRRFLPPIAIGISLYATLLSTISYLGKPGEMINKGPHLLVGQIVSIPFAYYIVGHWLIPRLVQQRVTSAYELLEARLGPQVRLLGALMFIGLRLVWMGLLIYLASVALSVVIGVEAKWIPLLSTVAGMVAVVYTSIGGLRTVVIADVFQFTLLLSGAILTIIIISIHLGGFGWWPSTWSPHWDRQPLISFDPHVRISMFGATISMLVWRVATAGGDQTAVQRFMATRDANAARDSYWFNSIATLVTTVILAILGLALLGFYDRFPSALGPGMTLKADADRLFPFFISNYLPAGLSGLVVSAALAAALSSVDSGVSAITSVLKRDILDRFDRRPRSPAADVRFSKITAFVIGIIVVGASVVMQYVPGNFMEMTSKTANLVVTPIFVLFILALWVPFATPLGAVVGCVYGLTTAILIAFWDVLTGTPGWSFQWVGPGAFVVDLSVSLAVSRWGPRPENRTQTRLIGATSLAILSVTLVAILP